MDKINENYSKITTIQMTFNNTIFTEPEKARVVKLKSGKLKLFHVIQGDNIKIEGKNIEILKDPKLGIIGNYKKQSLGIQYNHLTIWLAAVYRRAILYPVELIELKYYNVKIKKLKTEGYYKLFFSPKDQKDLFASEITVNMQ
ncbi:MAG: hypothetical protein KKH98_12685, partial [Spirochaetes bacterium]|nr:hypothetical protein [Spirochaetota bacterium]